MPGHRTRIASLVAVAPLVLSAAAPATAADEDDNVIEEAREGLRETALWLARGVDSWFGDQPFEQGGRVSDGRADFSLLKREGESPKVSVRFNARFRLPNVERRAYLFVGRDNPREVLTDTPGAFSRNQQLRRDRAEDRRLFAGIGFDLLDALDFRLGLRGGLKPYAQARWRHVWQPDLATRAEFRQTVFWSVDDHLGATSALSLERSLTPVWAARLLTVGTVTQDTGTLEWSQLAGMYRDFGAQRLLSFEAVIKGRLDRGGASDVGLRTRWEQPVYEDWLIGELLVGHFWPRAEGTRIRRTAWAVGAQLELRF